MPNAKPAVILPVSPDEIRMLVEAKEAGKLDFENMSDEERQKAGARDLLRATKALLNPLTRVG